MTSTEAPLPGSATRDDTATAADRPAAVADTSLVGRLQALRPKRLGLRTRILLMFVLGALLLSVFLGAVAYSFTRSSVLNQRERSAVEQARRDAQVAQNELLADEASATSAMNRLRQLGVLRVAVLNAGTWSAERPGARSRRDPGDAARPRGQRRRRRADDRRRRR